MASKDLIVPRFDAEGWWCEDGHKLPWNHPFCVANSPKGPTHERPDVINLLMMLTEERERLLAVVEAARAHSMCGRTAQMVRFSSVSGDPLGPPGPLPCPICDALDALEEKE